MRRRRVVITGGSENVDTGDINQAGRLRANADTGSGQGHVTRAADALDVLVAGALLEVISRPGVIEAMCNVVDSDDAELAALRAERATIRPRLNKAAKRYRAGEIDDEQLAIISKGLRQRDNEITAILTAANMRSPLDVLRAPTRSSRCGMTS